MDADTLGLLVPIIAICIPIVAIWTRYKTRIAKLQIDATAEKAAHYATQYASQNRALEERVRVLERIVTDKGYDVGVQIEALRDRRAVDRHERQVKDAPDSENGPDSRAPRDIAWQVR